MRSRFSGNYPPTKAELERLWSNAAIVFDTNALLNLYRYSAESRSDLLGVMKKLNHRIWIPHQVAFEFHENRLKLINKQQKLLDNLLSTLDNISQNAEGKLGEFSKNPFCDIDKVQKSISGHVEKIKSDVKRQHSDAYKQYNITGRNDPVLHELAFLYEGKVGRQFNAEELKELCGKADDRYVAETPPGYRDNGKESPAKYGDYLAWEQIIEYAGSNSTDILLVTDELKDDWWWINQGETIGPRPELRQEFADRTQHIYYQYKPGNFLSEVESRLKIEVPSKVVDEISETSTELARYEQTPKSGRSHYLRKRHEDSLAREYLRDRRLRDIKTASNEVETELVKQEDILVTLENAINELEYQYHTHSEDEVGQDAQRDIRSQLTDLRERTEETMRLITHLQAKRDKLALDRETELYRMPNRNRVLYRRYPDTSSADRNLFQDLPNVDGLHGSDGV